MPAIYAALDVFVLPSYREGFSRSGMEAAATGCAMVLSDIRGCRELGTDGEHLLLAPPGDAAALTAAVARLLDDAALRSALAESARQRALAAFDQRVIARASLDAYGRVLEAQGR
jgi:glycosyltransferase involved in cell wall biosynthesis